MIPNPAQKIKSGCTNFAHPLMTVFYNGVYFSASTVARYRASEPSDGMRKPVRGEKLKPVSYTHLAAGTVLHYVNRLPKPASNPVERDYLADKCGQDVNS